MSSIYRIKTKGHLDDTWHSPRRIFKVEKIQLYDLNEMSRGIIVIRGFILYESGDCVIDTAYETKKTTDHYYNTIKRNLFEYLRSLNIDRLLENKWYESI